MMCECEYERHVKKTQYLAMEHIQLTLPKDFCSALDRKRLTGNFITKYFFEIEGSILQ